MLSPELDIGGGTYNIAVFKENHPSARRFDNGGASRQTRRQQVVTNFRPPRQDLSNTHRHPGRKKID
jgi:ethanolamine utilization protein EutA (predicted chaperonin)